MIKALISDFSRVLLFPQDEIYTGGLNALQKTLAAHGEYDFWSYFRLNEELLSFYKTLSDNIGVYTFTTGYIQEHPALQSQMDDLFKAVFSCARLGLKKSDPQAYKMIADKIGVRPREVLYIDDQQKNLDIAKEAGFETILYTSNDQVIKTIQRALEN